LNISYLIELNAQFLLPFLDQSIGDKKKIQFIQALNAILNSHVECQIFVYLLGPGGTGKSTLANTSNVLWETNVLTTTLRDLHTDKFGSLKHDRKKLP
jgi:phage/plasmid-associated DNA primase